jgi:hypothetical protein
MFQVLFTYGLRVLKTLYFYFCKSIKKIIERIFAKNFARNHEKKKYLEHQTLGRWDDRPSNPANQRIILKIDGLLYPAGYN